MLFSIIGLNWGANYIKNIESIPGSRVISICSRDITKVDKRLSKKYNWTRDYKDSINICDSVVIAVADNDTKLELIDYALANKKNVIVEKPLIVSYEKYQEYKGLIEKHNLSFFVNFIHLFNNHYQSIAEQFKDLKFLSINSKAGAPRPHKSGTGLEDWASHDLAMILNIIESDIIETELNVVDGNFSINLEFQGGSNAKILCGNNFLKKYRKFSILWGNHIYASFEDDFKFNSLKAMLLNFIAAPNNNLNLNYRVSSALKSLNENSILRS